jgi:photosystem II stability/assembly factor-like uncharacterized protein
MIGPKFTTPGRNRFSLLAISLLAIFISVGSSVRAESGPHSTEPVQINWRVTGPIGGDVRVLVADPSDAQKFLIGTLDGQIYSSTDGARRWSRVEAFNHPGLYIDNIIIDPRDSKVIYVGAHKHKEPGGFFKSKDGGATWLQHDTFKKESIHALAQAPSNPDILFAGTNSGVFKSEDSGENWTRLETSNVNAFGKYFLKNIESIAIDPKNPEQIYCGTWHLPWKTTDGGRTWKFIKDGMIDDSDVFAINVNPSNPAQVIASACSGIYESLNNGDKWRKIQGIPSSSRRTRAILQHPTMPNVIFAGTTEGFWRSMNGGTSWTLMTSKQLEINSITVHPKSPNAVYIATNNHGVMISNDLGRSFIPSNEGYSGRRIFSVLKDREKPERIYVTTINTATGGGFFFISNDGGMTWLPSMKNMPNRLITYTILQDQTDANVIYLGTNLGIYRSADRGVSWAPLGIAKAPVGKGKRPAAQSRASIERNKLAQAALNSAGYQVGTPDGVIGKRTVAILRKYQTDKGIPQTGRLDAATLAALGVSTEAEKNAPVILSSLVNALAYTHDTKDGQPGLLAATATGLYRTYNPMAGWERLEYGSAIDARTLTVSSSPADAKTIWVGTSTSGVLVSRDSGASWQRVDGVPASAPINTIVQDQKSADKVYVGTAWSFYMTNDNGQKWERRGGSLPYGNFTSILINPLNSEEIYAGSALENGGGVYRSPDGGITWHRVDPQLPSHRVWTLGLASTDASRIFVGSHSGGLYLAERSASQNLSTSAVQ